MMWTRPYIGYVLVNGRRQEVRVQANSYSNAKKMLEAQYGNVMGIPILDHAAEDAERDAKRRVEEEARRQREQAEREKRRTEQDRNEAEARARTERNRMQQADGSSEDDDREEMEETEPQFDVNKIIEAILNGTSHLSYGDFCDLKVISDDFRDFIEETSASPEYREWSKRSSLEGYTTFYRRISEGMYDQDLGGSLLGFLGMSKPPSGLDPHALVEKFRSRLNLGDDRPLCDRRLYYIRRDAEEGVPEAQAFLAECYANGSNGCKKNDKEAWRLYKLAADQGDADAQNALGCAYWNCELGLERDEREAVRLFRLSANQGNASAQFNLAECYQDGSGGLQIDEREAVRLYRLAADQGHAGAQRKLALCYLNGDCLLPRDEKSALNLFRQAAEQNDKIAQLILGSIYQNGDAGLEKDEREALRLYELAADDGYALGQCALGYMYSQGLGGLKENKKEAARLYKLAAEQGYYIAQGNLGEFYEGGLGGLPQDDYEAARLYQLSAEGGNPEAQFNLARFYRDGRGGLPEDLEEAQRLFKLAVDGGYTEAQKEVPDYKSSTPTTEPVVTPSFRRAFTSAADLRISAPARLDSPHDCAPPAQNEIDGEKLPIGSDQKTSPSMISQSQQSPRRDFSRLEELERLAELKEKGLLNIEEFEKAKSKILGRTSAFSKKSEFEVYSAPVPSSASETQAAEPSPSDGLPTENNHLPATKEDQGGVSTETVKDVDRNEAVAQAEDLNEKVPPPHSDQLDVYERRIVLLRQLAELRDTGIISQSEFEREKEKLLNS